MFGAAVEDFRSRVGLTPHPQAGDERRKSYASLDGLHARLLWTARTLDDPFVALRVASHFDLDLLGDLSQTLFASDSLGTALARLAMRTPRIHNTGVASLTVRRSHVDFDWDSTSPRAGPPFNELALGVLVRVLRELCGPDVTPNEVRFRYSPPSTLRRYHELFGPHVRFGATKTGVTFAAEDLDRPVQVPTRVNSGDLLEAGRATIEKLARGSLPSLDDVAQSLGQSKRSLAATLRDSGINYKDWRDQVLSTKAKRLLAIPDVAIHDVAVAVGYSETSGFTRAFRRWTGMTPERWRRERGQP
jgi:AraC-like DNA-binding protein